MEGKYPARLKAIYAASNCISLIGSSKLYSLVSIAMSMWRIVTQIMTCEYRAKLSLLLSERFGAVEMPQELRKVFAFRAENFYGFFKGIQEHADKKVVLELYQALLNMSVDERDPEYQYTYAYRFIFKDFCYRYIAPFHKRNKISQVSPITYRAEPVISAVSVPVSKAKNDAEVMNLGPKSPVLSLQCSSLDHNNKRISPEQRQLNKLLLARDQCCLFCWDRFETQGAHILAQKLDIPFLLARCGLNSLYDVQNGLLLCGRCHFSFDKLWLSIEFDGTDMILKGTDFTHNATFSRDMRRIIMRIAAMRNCEISFNEPEFSYLPEAIQTADNLKLCFPPDTVESDKPSREALKLHREACNIWQMTHSSPESCDSESDDEEVGIHYALPNNISAGYGQDSAMISAWTSEVV